MTESSRAGSHRQPELFRLENLLTRRLGAEFFAALPETPGVYFHFDQEGRLLYIGQSSNLKNRVGSYRHVTTGRHVRRTVRLVARIHRIEWEACESAAAAIERERVLLLEHKPPFNRAGVWKGEPWWLELHALPSALVLSLNRDGLGQGPFPPSFRYVLGSMARCLYRVMVPEASPHLYPRGLMHSVVPLHVSLSLASPEAAMEMLRSFMDGKIGDLLTAAATWPDPPLSQLDEFWIEEVERVTQYAEKFATSPLISTGHRMEKPASLFMELPLEPA